MVYNNGVKNMKVYAYEYVIDKDGVLSLKNLPFNAGEKIEVIIIPRSKFKAEKKTISILGKAN